MATWVAKVDARKDGEEALLSQSYVIGAQITDKVLLREAPLAAYGVTIAGYTATTGAPAAGQYRVTYQGPGTGFVEFNTADANKNVTIDYKGRGSPIYAYDFNQLQTEKVDRDGSIPFTGAVTMQSTLSVSGNLTVDGTPLFTGTHTTLRNTSTALTDGGLIHSPYLRFQGRYDADTTVAVSESLYAFDLRAVMTAGGATPAGRLAFYGGGSELMGLTSGGSLLVGPSTGDGHTLDVQGTVRLTGALTFGDGTSQSTAAADEKVAVLDEGVVVGTGKLDFRGAGVSVGAPDASGVMAVTIPGAASGTFTGARCSTTAGQSIAHNTITRIDFGTKEYDPSGAVTVGASWAYTVPAGGDGYYELQACVHFNGNQWSEGDDIWIAAYKGGVYLAELDFRDGHDNKGGTIHSQPRVGGSTVVYLAAGNTIDFRVVQQNATYLEARVLSTSAAQNYCSITPIRLG